MKTLIGIFVLLSVNMNLYSFDKSKMDSLFSFIEKYDKGMGSISIYENGNEVYQKAYGFASIADSKPANSTTKYRIGSVSKTFTAAIILKLVEDSKLTLDTKLDKFYPEIKHSEKITIENLLRHSSGIYSFTNADDYTNWMETAISKEALINKIKGYEPVFEPNERNEYSNSNYVLLTFIAEKLYGKKYSDIIYDLIVRPLGLKNTYFGGKIDVKQNEALSYQKIPTWELSTETDMSVPVGAGAIVSTPTDLNHFLVALFKHKIIKPHTLEKMIEIKEGTGLGVFQIPFYDKKAWGHNGVIDGFQSSAFYFPDEKVSVAFTSNGVVMPMNDIMIGVLSIFFGMDYELPTYAAPIELTEEILKQYVGRYSNPEFPLKIDISVINNELMLQATGQSAISLEATAVNKFRFEPAMLTIEFLPEGGKFILKQTGVNLEFVRE